MSPSSTFSRRDLLKLGSIAAVAAPFFGGTVRAAESAAPKKHRFVLGVATFSLVKASVADVIKCLTTLRIDRASLYHSHAPWADGTPEACRAAVDQFTQAGIVVTGTGVVDFTTDEKAARKAFENVKAAGVAKICARPQIESLPLLNRLVKEYDVKLAIHNHGPTDLYPTSTDVWPHILPFDARIGICADVGHAWRAGGDPSEGIRLVKERLYEVHMKDTKGPKGTGTKDPGAVVLGAGNMDIRGIVSTLVEIEYAHEVEFEYEVRTDDKMPGLAESTGYIRGLLAGLNA